MSESDTPTVPETPAAPNPVVLNFLSKFCRSIDDGFERIRGLGALASDYADSPELQQPASTDFVNQFAGLTPQDVATAMAAVGAIVAVLDANDGALRKAAKKLAQRGY